MSARVVLVAIAILGIGGGLALRGPIDSQEEALAQTSARIVTAAAETDPVPHSADAADDSAIWVNPDDPSLSTVIGTDKRGGLAVYDLDGRQLHFYADSAPNNVDLRAGVPFGDRRVTLVVTSDLTTDALRIYTIDSGTRGLRDVSAGPLSAGISVHGLCLYHDRATGSLYAFGSDSSGTTRQWRITEVGDGRFGIAPVRTISLTSVVEGCVADDAAGTLFLAQEDIGIWRYGADPGAGSARVSVDAIAGGRLTADIEGLAIYRASSGAGYLIASSQGSDDYALYDRGGTHSFAGRFSVSAGVVDGTSHTDGIEVTNAALGPRFPEGLFVAQDDANGSENQNFKLVPWGAIARAGEPPLLIDTTTDGPGAGPGPGSVNPPTPASPPPRGGTLARIVLHRPKRAVTSFTRPRVVRLQATVAGGVAVRAVEFLDRGVRRHVDRRAPYTFRWAIGPGQNGVHRWRARAAFPSGPVVSAARVVHVRIPRRRANAALTAAVGSARTLYVDRTSGRDGNSGNGPDAAWQTLARVNRADLAPGDAVLLRRGERWRGPLVISRSGAPGAEIRIGAYGTGRRPRIGGASTCVRIDGSHVVIAELAIAGCSWAGVRVSGRANRLQDLRVTDTAAGVYLTSGARANRVVGNRLIGNDRMAVLTRGGHDDSGAFGILLHGDRNEIARNVISGSDAFSFDYGRDGAAIEVFGGRANLIHHNLAVDNDAFTELGNARSAGNTFAYNVVRSERPEANFVVTRGGSDGSRGPVLGTTLLSNTVYLPGRRSQGFVCFGACTREILRLRNNIILAGGKAGYADGPVDENYNLYARGRIQFTRGARSLVADPRFVAPARGDLRLRADSPALDRGIALAEAATFGPPVPLDGDGDRRARPDLGAFEREAPGVPNG